MFIYTPIFWIVEYSSNVLIYNQNRYPIFYWAELDIHICHRYRIKNGLEYVYLFAFLPVTTKNKHFSNCADHLKMDTTGTVEREDCSYQEARSNELRLQEPYWGTITRWGRKRSQCTIGTSSEGSSQPNHGWKNTIAFLREGKVVEREPMLNSWVERSFLQSCYSSCVSVWMPTYILSLYMKYTYIFCLFSCHYWRN